MPKYSLFFGQGGTRRHKTASQIPGIVYPWYKTIVAKREETNVRTNNELLGIVVSAENKNDFTGALFKNYIIYFLAPGNYFRKTGDKI